MFKALMSFLGFLGHESAPVTCVPETYVHTDWDSVRLALLAGRCLRLSRKIDKLEEELQAMEAALAQRATPGVVIKTVSGNVQVSEACTALVGDIRILREVLGEEGFAQHVQQDISYTVSPCVKRLALMDNPLGAKLRKALELDTFRVVRYGHDSSAVLDAMA